MNHYVKYVSKLTALESYGGNTHTHTHTHTQPTDGISRTTKVFGNYWVVDHYKTSTTDRLQSVIYLSGFPGTKAVKPVTVPAALP